MSHQLNDKKIINSWAMYDWANSVFSLTIATAIFPPYFESVTKAASIAAGNSVNGPYYISIFGFNIVNTAAYSFALSLGFLLIAFINPFLSGIADARKNKKSFLKFFCYMGSFSCVMMYFFTADTIFLGLILFVISLIGFGGSLVFYNAFLPEIVTEDNYDKVSARGFSLGYIGSVILLVINLVLIMMPELVFPVSDKMTELMSLNPSLSEAEALKNAESYFSGIASRLAFVSVGIWWAGFAQIPFKFLPEYRVKEAYSNSMLKKGFLELKKVVNEIRFMEHARIKRYLWGFFFTSMGLQTVMYVASLYGSQELKLPTSDLIITILIIQLIAVLGAFLFSRLSGKIGNIYTLMITIVIWIVITAIAYTITTKYEFYALGAMVGIVMGGIQSLFRSTFAKLIPDQSTNNASYFSFYDLTEKLATVCGTLVFGIMLNITGNMRSSVLALVLFFVIGLFFISRIKNFKVSHDR